MIRLRINLVLRLRTKTWHLDADLMPVVKSVKLQSNVREFSNSL